MAGEQCPVTGLRVMLKPGWAFAGFNAHTVSSWAFTTGRAKLCFCLQAALFLSH